jgi:hypothetical protein
MKRIIILQIILLASVAASAADPNLVGWWKFDEAAGLIAYDSASGNNGNLVNGPIWTTGQIGGGLTFDGSNDYVELDSPANLDNLPLNDLTISAWIYDRHNADNISDTWGTIFGTYMGSQENGWTFRTVSDPAGKRSLYFQVPFMGTNQNYWADYQSSYGTILNNKWHHVAAVWNAGTKTAKLYIDGTEPSYQVAHPGTGTYNSDAWNNKEIGRIPHAGGMQYFNGTIDDLRIYNKALSAEEVQQLYNPAGTNSNLVAWWKFDEGTGSVAADSAGTHNGTISGATWAAGHTGGALQFDGTNDYVTIPTAPELNITGNITIAAWVDFYEGGLGYDRSEKAIVTKCVGNGAYNNPYDFRTSISIEPPLAMVRANSSMHDIHYSDKYISLNTWHHVAVRVENMVPEFYVDGVKTGKWSGGPELTSPPTGNNYPVLIGARNDGLFFKGLIDDVRIYNRALSTEEIHQLYEENAPGLTGLDIVGPSEVAEESITPYKAIVRYDDGTTKDVTALAEWRAEPNSVAVIDAGQLATGQALYPKHKIKIYAKYTENQIDVNAQKQVSVIAICPNGNALMFDGTNDFVSINNNPTLNPTDQITICAWVKRDVTGVRHNVIAKHTLSSPFNGFHLLIDQANGAGFGLTVGSTWQQCGGGKINAATWYHLAGTFDGTQMKFFINGTLIGSKVVSGKITTNSNILCIGRAAPGFETGYFFDGVIDDVRIYNRALSAEEIATAIYTKPAGSEPNLAAYWDFDEGAGQTAADVSGHGNNGVLGSSSGIDTADPCWVESDAPVGRCTTEQVLGRNLFGATDDKKAANMLIAGAKAKEQASISLVDELRSQVTDINQQDAFKAKAQIRLAITQEEFVSRQIDMTIARLEEALRVLDYDVDSNSEPPPWGWGWGWGWKWGWSHDLKNNALQNNAPSTNNNKQPIKK